MSFIRKHSEVLTAAAVVGLLGAVAVGNFIIFQRSELISTLRNTGPVPAERKPISKQRLTILGDTFTGYSTFRSQSFQADLKDLGLTLSYEDEFSQVDRARRLDQRQADLIVTTLDQFLQQQPDGKIVGLIDRTIGADAIVLNSQVNPQISSLEDLRKKAADSKAAGQKLGIAFAAETPSEYLALVLDVQFEAFNLDDFELRPVADASEVWALMQDPEENIAVAVLWEPFVTQAVDQGNKVILSSKDAPKAIIDVIVASDRLLKRSPEVVEAFLEVYYRHIDSFVKDPTAFEQQLTADSGLSPEQATAVMAGIDFFTAPEALTWLTRETLADRIDATASILALEGRISLVPANSRDLFTTEPLRNAANRTIDIADLIRDNNPELAKQLMGEGQTIRPRVKTNVQPTQEDIGELKVQGKITFEVGTAQLTEASKDVLDTFAKQIRDFNTETTALKVIGHTSSIGPADRNMELSRQRADVVAQYLKNAGVQHTLTVEGQGSNLPLPEIDTTDSRNQRTEIRLIRIGN